MLAKEAPDARHESFVIFCSVCVISKPNNNARAGWNGIWHDGAPKRLQLGPLDILKKDIRL